MVHIRPSISSTYLSDRCTSTCDNPLSLSHSTQLCSVFITHFGAYSSGSIGLYSAHIIYQDLDRRYNRYWQRNYQFPSIITQNCLFMASHSTNTPYMHLELSGIGLPTYMHILVQSPRQGIAYIQLYRAQSIILAILGLFKKYFVREKCIQILIALNEAIPTLYLPPKSDKQLVSYGSNSWGSRCLSCCPSDIPRALSTAHPHLDWTIAHQIPDRFRR